VLLVKVNNLDTDWRRRKEGRGREKEKKKVYIIMMNYIKQGERRRRT
tara:strand:+ start:240 stop:380 length:141 start_codon:yes stop_codon:yes gene_type:complete